MAMTFLRFAALQLGRQLGRQLGAALAQGDAAAVLHLQWLESVKRIAGLARERNIDFVLVPGNHDNGEEQSPWSRLRRMGAESTLRRKQRRQT